MPKSHFTKETISFRGLFICVLLLVFVFCDRRRARMYVYIDFGNSTTFFYDRQLCLCVQIDASGTIHQHKMALWMIGLGLGDERDVTLKGADAIRGADIIFLESYTSVLSVPRERLEEAYGKKVEIAYRETVESEADKIIGPVKEGKNVAFLVVGDPFGATTHTDLLIRAQQEGVKTHVVHNASIMNAAGACGLQLYNFGQTVSIPYFRDDWRPDSFYDKIKYNAAGGMHTLALLGWLHSTICAVYSCCVLVIAQCCERSTKQHHRRCYVNLRTLPRCRHQGAGAQLRFVDQDGQAELRPTPLHERERGHRAAAGGGGEAAGGRCVGFFGLFSTVW